jgi:hypothetical protein
VRMETPPRRRDGNAEEGNAVCHAGRQQFRQQLGHHKHHRSGLIWVGSYFQVGLEAIIPVNRESGIGVGILGQLHLYPDDIFPIHWWRLERFC